MADNTREGDLRDVSNRCCDLYARSFNGGRVDRVSQPFSKTLTSPCWHGGAGIVLPDVAILGSSPRRQRADPQLATAKRRWWRLRQLEACLETMTRVERNLS